MQVQSLGREDPLQEGMTTHSSILALRIPMDRGATQAVALRIAESQTPLSNFTHTHMNILLYYQRRAKSVSQIGWLIPVHPNEV